jgi:hypothetical protein
MALISEGVGDMIFAIEAQISGNFSWSAYMEHKLISLAMSIVTCGVGAACSFGVQVAETGMKTVLRKVGKKIVEAVSTAISGFAIDKIIDAFFAGVMQVLEKQFGDVLSGTLHNLQEKLNELLQKTQNSAAVQQFMQRLEEDYFSDQQVAEKAQRYFHHAIGAIAQGLGNAAKIRKLHGAAFAGVANAAKVLQQGLRACKHIENFTKAITEINRFLSHAIDRVDLEISKAALGSNPAEGNNAFIAPAVAEWERRLKEKILSYVKDGMLKSEAKLAVNKFLQKIGHQMNQKMFDPAFMRNNKHIESLEKVRTTNLDRLASKDAMFKTNRSKTPHEIISTDPTMRAVNPPDDSLCANTDGHTVGDIKTMIPGVVFFEIGEGTKKRMVFLPSTP